MERSRKLFLTDWTQANDALNLHFEGNKSKLADHVKMSRTTVTNFFSEKPVRESEFRKLCLALRLNWQAISSVHMIAPSESPIALSPSPSQPNEDLIQQVREHCRQKILNQHSRMRLLSGEEIGVDQLYVDVWLLNRSPRTFQVSESKLLESFDLRNDRLGLGDRIRRNPGFEVANSTPKLMIFGKPGSGKTTFLKHLAVDWCNAKFHPDSTAVLIELRQIRGKHRNLLDEVYRGLGLEDWQIEKSKPLKEYEEQIENLERQRTKLEIESELTELELERRLHINREDSHDWRKIGEEIRVLKEQVKILKYSLELPLRKGKFLILMDGFDEILTKELRQNFENQLRQFVTDYPHHRFVLTCRTQIMDSVPDGFASVEIADFSTVQVRQFVSNWFKASGKSDIEVDNYQEAFECQVFQNLVLRELTVTSVILSLICLVLQDEGEIPANITWLYKKGVKLLLKKWNDQKRIDGWEIGSTIYQKLSIEEKEKLLIEIAARKFENPENFVLFEQEEIINLIARFLLSTQDESIAILKSIEAQHGLLIERADELWSFSHLTFQEYFTVQWLTQLNSEQLAQKITNHRWQEVVKQLARSQQLTNRLLKLIKQAIDQLIADEPVIDRFLVWLLQKSRSVPVDYKPAIIRTFYFDLICARALSHQNTFSLLLPLDRALSHTLALAFNFDYEIAGKSGLSTNLDPNLDLDVALDRILNRDYTYIALSERLSILSSDCQYAYISACACAPDLANKLEQFRTALPTFSSGDWRNREQSWQTNIIQWLEQLRQMMMEHRNIGHDWQFTNSEAQKLQRYYDANKFLVELMKIEDATSNVLRAETEDSLLLPWEELQCR